MPWANFAGAPAPGVYRVTVDPAMGLLCMKAFPRLRGESLSCFSSPTSSNVCVRRNGRTTNCLTGGLLTHVVIPIHFVAWRTIVG